MPEPVSDMNRNQEVGFFGENNYYSPEDSLEINMRNLENLSLLDNLNAVHGLTGLENNENIAFFQDYEAPPCNNSSSFMTENEDSKEPNVSRTVRVPTSEHVAEIVGRQGCKIKDLRARTNTYIKTPMRTEPPVFVVTGKETAVNLVIAEINSAAEHFTQIRASRNHHKNGGGGEVAKPVSREGDVVLHVTVPYRVVGLVVGLKGQTIKQIQQDTDTFIVTPNRDKAPIFEIRGQPSNVERARLMIERHIEMRTRNCRLQDTTNLQSNWNGSSNDDSRYGGNDLHYYYSDSSPPQNGNSNSNPPNSYTVGGGMCNNNGYNGLHSPNFSQFSSSSTPQGNYNSWRGYSGMMDSSASDHSTPIQTWSNATSDYTTNIMGNNHSASMRSGNSALQYNMSLGTLSSNSNESGSLSPPQEFLNGGSFSSRPMPGLVGGSSGRRTSDPACDNSSFPSFPLFSSNAPSSTCPKGSLVLGNLLQSTSSVSPSTANAGSAMGNRDLSINSFGRSGGSDGVGFATPSTSDFCSFRSVMASGDSSTGIFGPMSTTDMNGFPSGDSSPASKSCSVSETSGSQGSPTPRMCKVCEEADVVAALVPCGHNHFCMECAEGIINKPAESDRKCPICNAAAADVLRILA